MLRKYKQELRQVRPGAITTPSTTANSTALSRHGCVVHYVLALLPARHPMMSKVRNSNLPSLNAATNEDCRPAFSSGCLLGPSAYSGLQKAEGLLRLTCVISRAFCQAWLFCEPFRSCDAECTTMVNEPRQITGEKCRVAHSSLQKALNSLRCNPSRSLCSHAAQNHIL